MAVIEQLLVHWRSVLLAAVPLIALYLYQRFKKAAPIISAKRLAEYPQPEGWTEKEGHWPWIVKAATSGEGDPRRSFGTWFLIIWQS